MHIRAGWFLAVRFNLGVGTALVEHYLGTLLDFKPANFRDFLKAKNR